MAADMGRVQARLLEMAKAAAGILEKHDMPYIMICGTLKGAVLYKGFSPGSGDIDFCLFDDSYAAAIEHLRAELPPELFLEDAKSEPLYFHAWAHIKDLNSEVQATTPQDNYYAHRGLHIDLYRMKKMKLCEVPDYQNSENRAYIQRRKGLGLMDGAEYRERMERLAADENWARARPYSSEREVYATGVLFTYFESGDIFPLKKYRFEDTDFFGPADADRVLTAIYGDYAAPPPPEKQTEHLSSVRFFDHRSDP